VCRAARKTSASAMVAVFRKARSVSCCVDAYGSTLASVRSLGRVAAHHRQLLRWRFPILHSLPQSLKLPVLTFRSVTDRAGLGALHIQIRYLGIGQTLVFPGDDSQPLIR
jgi:hypothetical protein